MHAFVLFLLLDGFLEVISHAVMSDAVADGGPGPVLPVWPPVSVRAGRVSAEAERRGNRLLEVGLVSFASPHVRAQRAR